ncbi:hypothetical protein XELAEV_18040862mg [Xenopus laevis]|uniref:Uncharacterized protein n=1 Tax=Xenopus laevis TaxID=8355 RepID=A0A974CAH5_XENLA|nr:hypothetical protein XELAEV_18040862mg [Xenopus laevis]
MCTAASHSHQLLGLPINTCRSVAFIAHIPLLRFVPTTFLLFTSIWVGAAILHRVPNEYSSHRLGEWTRLVGRKGLQAPFPPRPLRKEENLCMKCAHCLTHSPHELEETECTPKLQPRGMLQ